MNIIIHHSGSAGNLFQADDLLLDPGVRIREIRRCLGFGLNKIAACLLTHEHMDHAKGAKELLRAGIDLYCSRGTAEALGLSGHRLHIVEAGRQANIGPWRIMPFVAIHDVKEPLSFLIVKGRERLLFAVDTAYIPHRFRGLTHVMLGVDFEAEILKENVALGHIDAELAKRIMRNHMSLETAKDFFRANDMSQVQEIYLLHLSEVNADVKRFKRDIERVTGRPVYAKCPGAEKFRKADPPR